MKVDIFILSTLVILNAVKQSTGWAIKKGKDIPFSVHSFWSRTSWSNDKGDSSGHLNLFDTKRVSNTLNSLHRRHLDALEKENVSQNQLQPASQRELQVTSHTVNLPDVANNYLPGVFLQSKHEMSWLWTFALPSSDDLPKFQKYKTSGEQIVKSTGYGKHNFQNLERQGLRKDEEHSMLTNYTNDVYDNKYVISTYSSPTKKPVTDDSLKYPRSNSNSTTTTTTTTSSIELIDSTKEEAFKLSLSENFADEKSNHLINQQHYDDEGDGAPVFNHTQTFSPWYQLYLNEQPNEKITIMPNSFQKLHRGTRAVDASGMSNNCHSRHLHKCGTTVIREFNLDPSSSKKCKIREEFLDCMVNERERGCSLSEGATHSAEDTKVIRSEVKSLLWSANGCLF